MNKLLTLTGVLLKNTRQFELSKDRFINRSLIVLIFLSLTPIIFLLVGLTSFTYNILLPIEQEGIIIAYLFVILSIAVFFFGIFYVLSTFYYAKDIELLLHLPFSPYQILGAKFITVLVYEYIVVLFFFCPIVITYGIISSASLVFYIFSLILFFVIPIIPLVLGSVFTMIIMAFSNIGKRKELMTFFGSLLVLVIALGFNIVIQALTRSGLTKDETIELLTEGNNSMVSVISKSFLGTNFGIDSLINYNTYMGSISLVIYILIVVFSIIVFLLLGQKLYFKGVIGISQSTAKRKSLTAKDWTKYNKKSSLIKSYTIRELKLLLRSPIYFINCILIGVLLPLVFMIMIIFIPSSQEEFDVILSVLSKDSMVTTNIAVLFGVCLFFTAVNGITSTGISREGNNAYIMKYVPVPIIVQISGKISLSIIFGSITCIIFGICAAYIGISLPTVILATVVTFNGVIFSSLIGIAIDLVKPKLQWDSEQQAVKQNINIMISLAICFSTGLIFGLIVILFSLNLLLTLIMYLGIITLINFIIYITIKKFCIKVFIESEI